MSARAEERRRVLARLRAGPTGWRREGGKEGSWAGHTVGRDCSWAEKRERTGRKGWAVEMRKEGDEEKMGRGRIERAGRLGQNERGRKEGEKNCFLFFFNPISKSNSNQFEFF